MGVRHATEADLEAIVRLIAGQQVQPNRHIPYLGSDPDSIRADITAMDDWTARTVVSAPAGGTIDGCLLAEVDTDMGRCWWWGPFVSADDWAGTADALYTAAPGSVETPEQELAPDDRNLLTAEFALRHGFDPETASAVLTYTGPNFRSGHGAVAPAGEWKDEVAALHDLLFPGTHTTGRTLVDSDDIRLVIVESEALCGYVAAEVHSDGSGYIDYLGVVPDTRRRGVGRRLVQAAVDALRERGAASVDLTVREDNHAARRLYASLGFTEERLVRPYRKGFTLETRS